MKRVMPATRSEWIAGVALLVTVFTGITLSARKDGAQERELQRMNDERATLMTQRNRENDLMERRLAALELALRGCAHD